MILKSRPLTVADLLKSLDFLKKIKNYNIMPFIKYEYSESIIEDQSN